MIELKLADRVFHRRFGRAGSGSTDPLQIIRSVSIYVELSIYSASTILVNSTANGIMILIE